jgi:hypothetical protein
MEDKIFTCTKSKTIFVRVSEGGWFLQIMISKIVAWNFQVFWDVMSCEWHNSYRRFGTAICLHFYSEYSRGLWTAWIFVNLAMRSSIVSHVAVLLVVRGSRWVQIWNGVNIINTSIQLKTRVYYSGPSSYDRPDIRTTWVTTKILVLTYDQSLELRPEWRSRPKRVSACAVVNKDSRCVR